MSGFDVSSSERFSGPIRIEAALAEGPEGAIDRVRGRIRAFADAIDAGYFFPARMRSAAPQFGGAGDAVHVSLQVDELPLTALDVLGGMLRDCRHDEVHLRSAHAELDRRQRDLLRDTGWRPEAPDDTPFEVEFPEDLGGNYALLVEIEFAQPVPPALREGLLADLALWDELTRAYPDDPDDPVDVSGAQAMFNDPRTIHYHEWVWDNADVEAWDLIVNLCCVWHQTLPIVRLHFE